MSNPVWPGRLRLGAALMVAAVLGLASGCASKVYRSSGAPCEIDRPEPKPRGGFDWESNGTGRPCAERWQVNVTKPVPFSVNFVEIDEQGILADRRQAEAAIENASREEADGSYVVVFVHGWHHNAGTDDDNVRGFYDTLAQVSRWNPKRKIKGVYIGWRGDSLPVMGLRYLTFWDRKNTSDEVGRGGLLEFLLRLERGVKAKAKQNPLTPNRLVVIGHSFGASVTFNALAHIYLGRFLDGVHSNETKDRFRGYGDLVVLINPAIEAMRYMPFQSALEYYSQPTNPLRLDFSRETRPALVVLSSQSDWATHLAFPVARFFSTALEAHSSVSAGGIVGETAQNSYSEWVMDRDTVGNFLRFHTHHPLLLAEQPADPNQTRTSNLDETCGYLSADDMWQRLNVDVASEKDESGGAVFPDSGVRVRRIPNPRLAGSPYIVAAVSPKIINGHTDIGRRHLVCWINQLLDTRDAGLRPLQP